METNSLVYAYSQFYEDPNLQNLDKLKDKALIDLDFSKVPVNDRNVVFELLRRIS